MRCSIPSRRERIAAIAATADYNPEEAAVAAAMLARIPESRLETIASEVKAEYGRGIEAQFAIGRLLIEARSMFPADIEFGRWFADQKFPFSYMTSWRLRIGVEREQEVRSLIDGLSAQKDREFSVPGAVQELMRKPKAPLVVDEAEAEVHGDAFQITSPLCAAFEKAGRAVIAGIGTLPADELVQVASLIRDLAVAYNAEREVRSNGRAA